MANRFQDNDSSKCFIDIGNISELKEYRKTRKAL